MESASIKEIRLSLFIVCIHRPLETEFTTRVAYRLRILKQRLWREIIRFPQNKQAANVGGKVAGNARRELEKKSGRKVVTSENYLALTQAMKKAKSIK